MLLLFLTMIRKKIVIDEIEKPVPLIVNLIINIFITFALSLSIYLLIGNIFLIINKISIEMPFSDLRYASSRLNGDEVHNVQNENYQAVLPIYYDCSKSVLSMEECDLINRYHHDHSTSVNKLLSSASSNVNILNQLEQQSSLKVNTSLYIR